jgi:DNA invertase Pin-like site-specific DNA recombinase
MNAIIYSRVSTDDQDNARQIAELKSYAQYKKFKVLKVFEEKITGASKGSQRVVFKQLLEYLETNEIDSILVWELSRLGRSMLDVLNNIEAFSEKRINVFIKKEGMNTLDEKKRKSTMTTLLISILSGFAEMERDTIRQRSISGLRYNASTGGAGTGVIKPYGYEAIQKKLYVNAEEAKVVRMMFSKYLSGLGTGAIAKYLNAEGVPTRFAKLFAEKEISNKVGFQKKGNDFKWVDGTVYSILTNSIYKGDRKHKGEVFKIEPIVDPQTFERVQARLRENYNKNSSKVKYFNPLKDIIKCGHPECENRGYSYYMHKRPDNKDNAYKCISKRYNNFCGNPSIGIDKLLKGLFWICQPLIVNDALTQKSKNQNSLIEAIENKNIEIQGIQKDLLSLNTKLNSLIRMNLDGQIDAKRFTQMNSEFLSKITNSNERLVILSEDLDRLKKVSEAKPVSSYSLEIFNQNIKGAVDYIKVHSVTNPAAFSDHLRIKNDVAVILEVKSLLAFNDGRPAATYFALSRYSDNLMYLEFQSPTKDPIRLCDVPGRDQLQ